MTTDIDKYKAGTGFMKYALTVTLKPDFCSGFGHYDQYNITYPQLKDILSDCTKDAYISAELTKNRNIHYHCLIETKVPTTIKEMRYLIDANIDDTLFGFYWLKPIEDESGWLKYMYKNQYNFVYSF